MVLVLNPAQILAMIEDCAKTSTKQEVLNLFKIIESGVIFEDHDKILEAINKNFGHGGSEEWIEAVSKVKKSVLKKRDAR